MKKIFSIVLSLLAIVWVATAQNIPSKPNPPRLVNDFAGLFTPDQIRQLEDSLVNFERTTSNQIVVVTTLSLNDIPPADFALQIMRNWGVGQKDKNNGVVMLLKPRTETKGEINIQVGYGLEGVLPDSRVGRIIDNQMIPYLAKTEYFTATQKGIAALMAATRGEYSAAEEGDTPYSVIGFVVMALFIFFLIALLSSKSKHNDDDSDGSGGGGGGVRRGSALPPIFWGLGGFGSGAGQGSSGGGFGGFGSGGFGGFGGGSGGGGGGGRSF